MMLTSTVGIVDGPAGPTVSMGNSPNPFSDITTIAFQLQQSAHVSLRICDITGKLVREQDLGTRALGPNTVLFDGSDLASGTYTCTLYAGGTRTTRHMIIAR
ncbi:MAG: T9SS type A sorting domain-containing protein [Flavobacteriales bacterium]